MYRGFPVEMVALLRCPSDARELVPEGGTAAPYLVRATLRCLGCGAEYPIEDGIVRLLEGVSLDTESRNEQAQRDAGAVGLDPSWETSAWNELEIVPTLEASEPLAGALVLELGAGTGRYTVPMNRRGAAILAVDFSARSLENLASRVQASWRIGLVQADCTRLGLAARQFDLVASTLVSNLPTEEHRAAVFALAARACKSEGKFVFSVHHFGVRSRLRGEPASGYYREAPIYRRLFRPREIEEETRRVFADVEIRPIQIAVPVLGRLPFPVVSISRLLERVPVINALAELLLLVAHRPTVSIGGS
jgi:SAM-dependent methyltransferase